MAKVTNPTTFSMQFNVEPETLECLGVLDPTLALDTKLFIDPLLLAGSVHPEMNDSAIAQYRQHFEGVIKLLDASTARDDIPWRNARRMLEFHEIRGTCLGYGADTISGSGFGAKLTTRLVTVAREIVRLGIKDPDLFPLMALLESDIGPDRISDMTTNVIRRALIEFNARVLTELGIAGEDFSLFDAEGRFARNPLQRSRTPIILVPQDILRQLPIARDWDSAQSAASENDALRARVNTHVGEIWMSQAKRRRERLEQEALASKEAFQTLLDCVHAIPRVSYDAASDPDGVLTWPRVARHFAENFPLKLETPAGPPSLDALLEVVRKIVAQFRHLVEHRGLNKDLYHGKKPRHESTAQRLFFAVAYAYCEANNIDISPELDTGSGKVDFKFSTGFDARVLVEVKLSTNPKLIHGYDVQLEVYRKAEETIAAVYLVLDVGRLGEKDEALLRAKNAAAAAGHPAPDVEIVDATLKKSASKR